MGEVVDLYKKKKEKEKYSHVNIQIISFWVCLFHGLICDYLAAFSYSILRML